MSADTWLLEFFEKYAVCSCGEQAYNINDGICGWCGAEVGRAEGGEA